ncbi:MAG: hypothetical protein WCF23_00895 [Candidatus Nitrosopolaris sp.]
MLKICRFIILGIFLMFVVGMIGMDHHQTMLVKLNLQPTFASNNNNNGSKISVNQTNGQYSNANNTQEWRDPEKNLKIHFMYLPEYPLAGNITLLKFDVQNLQTGSNMRNLFAGITITNNLTIAKIDGIKDTNGEFSRFVKISAPNGVFSLNYRFLEEGTHQVIFNVRSGNFSLALASFNVFVQPVV